MTQEIPRIINGKLGMTVIPDNISADKIQDGSSKKLLTAAEKTKLSNIGFGDFIAGQTSTAIDAKLAGAPFLKNSGSQQVTVYIQATEPSNWKENDLWIIPLEVN